MGTGFTYKLFCFVTIFVCVKSRSAIIHDVQLQADSNQSWKSASENCLLAGINFTGEVDTTTIRFNVTNKGMINNAVWIGAYVKYTPWFEFEGCLKGSTITNYTNFSIRLSKEPVKDCYNRCKGDFWLNEDSCLCETDIQYIASEGGECLAEPCKGNNQEFCGESTHPKKCLCKFRIDDSGNHYGIGNCVTKKQQKYYNANCSEHHNYHCMELEDQNSNGQLNWSAAILQCYQRKKPFTYKSLNSSETFWSGIFRKYTYMWGYPSLDVNYHCLSAYLEQDGFFTLKIRRCNEQLPVLCHLYGAPINSVRENVTLVPRTGDSFDEDFNYYIYIIPTSLILLLLVSIATGVFLRQRGIHKALRQNNRSTTLDKGTGAPLRQTPSSEQRQQGEFINDTTANENQIAGNYSELHNHNQNRNPTSTNYYHADVQIMEQNEGNTYGYSHFQRQKPGQSYLGDYDTMANIRANEESTYGIQPKISTDASMYDTTASVRRDSLM